MERELGKEQSRKDTLEIMAAHAQAKQRRPPQSIHVDGPQSSAAGAPVVAPQTAKVALRDKLNVFSDLSDGGGDESLPHSNKAMKILQNKYANVVSEDDARSDR